MENLFEEWKRRSLHSGKLFISDGIIDKEKWGSARTKTLFLLKEAYDSNPDQDWDLCTQIRDVWKGPKYKMWWTVAQWAYGLSALAEDRLAPFTENEGKLRNALLSSAVVNIKKSNGQSTSKKEELLTYLESDWDLIEDQIRMIGPDIIVCGNTWSLISDRLGNPNQMSEWVYRAMGYHFVDFWHPANQFPNRLNYYGLCSAVYISRIMVKN